MKLFFSPGATSLAVRIVLEELRLPAQFAQVDLEHQSIQGSGAPYEQVNPMGKVPALELDDGQVLTEGAAILQYLADRVPAARLATAPGTLGRYRMAEALNFLASEVHKGYAAIFDPAVPGEYRGRLLQDTRPIRRIIGMVTPGPFVFGDKFTIADAYLYSLLRLAMHAGMDFEPFPPITAFFAAVDGRASVRAAARTEGLVAR